MPKYYCDYCDVFLTHDSSSVRKAHNSGRNHLTNVRDYYASLGHDKAQNIIDQITKMYDGGNAAPTRMPLPPQSSMGGLPPTGFPPAPSGFPGDASFGGGPPPMFGAGGNFPPPMNGMSGPPADYRPPPTADGSPGINPERRVEAVHHRASMNSFGGPQNKGAGLPPSGFPSGFPGDPSFGGGPPPMFEGGGNFPPPMNGMSGPPADYRPPPTADGPPGINPERARALGLA